MTLQLTITICTTRYGTGNALHCIYVTMMCTWLLLSISGVHLTKTVIFGKVRNDKIYYQRAWILNLQITLPHQNTQQLVKRPLWWWFSVSPVASHVTLFSCTLQFQEHHEFGQGWSQPETTWRGHYFRYHHQQCFKNLPPPPPQEKTEAIWCTINIRSWGGLMEWCLLDFFELKISKYNSSEIWSGSMA